jgi:hypothetical protein
MRNGHPSASLKGITILVSLFVDLSSLHIRAFTCAMKHAIGHCQLPIGAANRQQFFPAGLWPPQVTCEFPLEPPCKCQHLYPTFP